MKMADMKLPKKKEAKNEGVTLPGMDMREEYPYGLRISLDNEQLEKLGAVSDYNVGDSVFITATGTVVTKSANDRQGGKKDRRIEIQIKKLSCGAKPKMSDLDSKEYYKQMGEDGE